MAEHRLEAPIDEQDGENRRIRVLVVDDNEGDFHLVKSLLAYISSVNYVVSWQPNGEEIIKRPDALDADICLIDYNLGHETGLELVQSLSQAQPHLPTILLTGESDREIDVAAMQAGASDFIEKARFDGRALDRTIRYAIEQKRVEKHLAAQAERDDLTGLYNRAGFAVRLEQAMAVADRTDRHLAVMFLDLDRFKHVNDSLGHAVGDALLREVARRLEHCCRKSDVVARMGGDEFAVIATHIKEVTGAGNLADKFLMSFVDPFEIDGHTVHAGASIGVTTYPGDGEGAERLLMNADMALYRAKAEGRGRYAMFDVEMERAAKVRRQTGDELHRAITGNDLFLEYQPIVDSRTGAVAALEALVRWDHVDGVRYPASFIEIAESSNLINRLGEWVLRDACRTAARRAWKCATPVPVAVNLSAAQLAAPDLVGTIQLMLAETGLAPELLQLEITESVMIPNFEGGERVLNRLRELGVGISIDDFGTGYTALQVLRRLPVDQLKIDRSFVAEITEDGSVPPVVNAIIEIGRSFGLKLVAEGVETATQMDCLCELGVDLLQGFHISRPQPLAVIEAEFPMEDAERA